MVISAFLGKITAMGPQPFLRKFPPIIYHPYPRKITANFESNILYCGHTSNSPGGSSLMYPTI